MQTITTLPASLFLFVINVVLSQKAYRPYSASRIVYKWSVVEFDYPSQEATYDAIVRGRLIPNNVAVLDADYHAPTKRYFVTTPQMRAGVPATLSQVIDAGQGILKPFPSWPKYNKTTPSCKGLFSVLRIQIDKCGLLWALDSGTNGVGPASTLICPPKLVIYDLNNGDREVLQFEFPADVLTNRTLLNNLVLESYENDCSDTVAYISDANDHGLVLFVYPTKKSWRIDNKLFYPYPDHAAVTTNGVTVEILSGILGITLGPLTEPNRRLYFHSYASVRESWVPVSVLKAPAIAQDEVIARIGFWLSPGRRAGQSTVQVMTDNGILIYALIPTNEIACWNIKRPFTLENQHVIERNDEDFQYITGLKLKSNKLYILSSRLQNYLIGNANNTEVKYRVMVIDDVQRLLQKTPCYPLPSESFIGSELVTAANGVSSDGGFNPVYYSEPNDLYTSGEQPFLPQIRYS